MINFILIVVFLVLGIVLQRVAAIPKNTPKILNWIVIQICLPALALYYIPKIQWNTQLWISYYYSPLWREWNENCHLSRSAGFLCGAIHFRNIGSNLVFQRANKRAANSEKNSFFSAFYHLYHRLLNELLRL